MLNTTPRSRRKRTGGVYKISNKGGPRYENTWQLRNTGQQVGKNNNGDVELSIPTDVRLLPEGEKPILVLNNE